MGELGFERWLRKKLKIILRFTCKNSSVASGAAPASGEFASGATSVSNEVTYGATTESGEVALLFPKKADKNGEYFRTRGYHYLCF